MSSIDKEKMDLLIKIESKCPKCKSGNINVKTKEEAHALECEDCGLQCDLESIVEFLEENLSYNKSKLVPNEIIFNSTFAARLNEQYKNLRLPIDNSYYIRLCEHFIEVQGKLEEQICMIKKPAIIIKGTGLPEKNIAALREFVNRNGGIQGGINPAELQHVSYTTPVSDKTEENLKKWMDDVYKKDK